MITKNGKELLNLENSVERLKELVEQHYAIDRVIADFGITMVNDPLTQSPEVLGLKGTKWGEAYPVGYGTPYDIWVWTRPNPNEENVLLGGWLNIGPLAIPGPAGKDGVGERGEPGRTPEIYAGEYYTEVANPEPGDYFLDKDSGDLYKYTQFGGWGLPIANLKGAPGESIQGPPGQTAPIITLLGIVEGTDELPPAGPAYVGKGYIVSFESGIRTVYTVMEDEIDSGTYGWKIAGSISGYSIIEANGEVVSEWDADTKLDKITDVSVDSVYATTTTKAQIAIPLFYAGSNARSGICGRLAGGRVDVRAVEADTDATNKAYVDNNFVPKLEIAEGTGTFAYIAENNGKTSKIQIQYGSPIPYTLPARGEGGRVVVGTPTGDTHAATKKYVDDTVSNRSPKLYRHTIYASCYGNDYDGQSHTISMNFEILSTQSTDVSSNYVPVASFVNLLAGNSAPIAYIVANGYIDDEPIGYVAFSRDYTITVYNRYNELIAAFQEENGICEDTVLAIG